MHAVTTLSTVIDARVKKAVAAFCRSRGLKLRYVIEQALVEQLEDALDLQAYRERRSEETIPLEKIIAGIKKK